jgi:glycosyltransferase involved in cell wall biosynthesis
MRCLLLSRYGPLGASSRMRSYQYLRYLRTQGIQVSVAPFVGDDYLRELYAGKPRQWKTISRAYLRRLISLLGCRHYDLLWIEYELFPWLPAWVEWLLSHNEVPYVVDYDDAVFHRYDLNPNRFTRAVLSKKIDRVMKLASLVMVGNDYLAKRARDAGAQRVEYLPTVVDLDRYPLTTPKARAMFTIGWIGSPTTFPFLQLVRSALDEVCRQRRARLVLVGAPHIQLSGVPTEFREWSEDTEAASIQDFDVGIMPLPDDPWARGKCGYKLVQYMASARSAIASPIGVNRTLIRHRVNGLLAESEREWVEALRFVCDNPTESAGMGRAGREMVEREYCLQVMGPRLSLLLREAAERRTN